MSPSTLFFKLTVTLAAVQCLPLNPMRRSVDSDADELTEKLSKLKTLLEKLEDAKITKSNLTKDLKEHTKNRKDHDEETLDEDKTVEAEEDMVDPVVENDSQEKIINMKRFIESLTPKDLKKLQMLKTLVQEAKEARSEDMVNEGSFADTEVPESKEKIDIINWKEIAKQLENERDVLYLKNRKQENKPKHIEAETQEGTFGAFKDEIKYAVEKNLLTDVALAIHSGISVDEILADITGQGNVEPLNGEWTRRNRD